jgi:hypothetical protein
MLSRILWKLDDLYFAFKRAVKVLKNPNLERDERDLARLEGVSIAKAKVRYALRQSSPDDFQSEEFRLGYLYAQGVVQKVLP